METSNETGGAEMISGILTSRGCENLADYISRLGLTNDPNTLVLPERHHYYYDKEELRSVNTIISLKELNQIKQIKEFLHSIVQVLEQSSNFVGYFTDNKRYSWFGRIGNSSPSGLMETASRSASPILNLIYNFMGSHLYKMSKKNVKQLLEDYGFQVLDMSELNGITYFHAQVE